MKSGFESLLHCSWKENSSTAKEGQWFGNISAPIWSRSHSTPLYGNTSVWVVLFKLDGRMLGLAGISKQWWTSFSEGENLIYIPLIDYQSKPSNCASWSTVPHKPDWSVAHTKDLHMAGISWLCFRWHDFLAGFIPDISHLEKEALWHKDTVYAGPQGRDMKDWTNKDFQSAFAKSEMGGLRDFVSSFSSGLFPWSQPIWRKCK